MIAHQHVRMHLDPEPLRHCRQQFQKMPPVPVIEEKPSPAVPPRRNVIPPTRDIAP